MALRVVLAVLLSGALGYSPPPADPPTLDGHAAPEPVAFVVGPLVEPAVEGPREPQSVATEPPAAPGPCADALDWVTAAGLPLPSGVAYHCPSTLFAHHGAACWNGIPCPGGGFIAINVDLIGSPGPEYLRHVVAHEVCHILDFRDMGFTTEAGADACAAAHGA